MERINHREIHIASENRNLWQVFSLVAESASCTAQMFAAWTEPATEPATEGEPRRWIESLGPILGAVVLDHARAGCCIVPEPEADARASWLFLISAKRT